MSDFIVSVILHLLLNIYLLYIIIYKHVYSTKKLGYNIIYKYITLVTLKLSEESPICLYM